MNKLESIMFQGQEHEIKINTYAGKTTQVLYRQNAFIVYINNKVKESMLLQQVSNQLRDWMLEQAEKVIKNKVRECAKIIGVEYNNIRIKDTKTRWGSCSSKKNLNFNFRLMMAPERVMDYVIIHELCHLLHMNHSKEFWAAVKSYMPDFEEQKSWLKYNGGKLYKL